MEPDSTAPSPLVFSAGEMAVHPAHGVGEVLGVENRDVGGQTTPFYVLAIFETGLKVLVALGAVDAVGLRRVMSSEQAHDVLQVLRAPEVAVDAQPWARRQRIYSEMMKTGSPLEIAKVWRDMSRLSSDKDLSFAERRLLDHARGILIHELELATETQRAAIDGELAGGVSAA